VWQKSEQKYETEKNQTHSSLLTHQFIEAPHLALSMRSVLLIVLVVLVGAALAAKTQDYYEILVRRALYAHDVRVCGVPARSAVWRLS
jgi:hypothetical protein